MSRESRRNGSVRIPTLVLVLILGLSVVPAIAQQKIHEEYTKKILEFKIGRAHV